MLSVTAILTAWCGFQASKWSGERAIAFAEASAARVEATDADGEAREARVVDLIIYAEWVTATAQGDTVARRRDRGPVHAALQGRLRRLAGRSGRPSPARSRWPSTCRRAPRRVRSASAYAETRFAEALEYTERGDNYSLLTVLFALVLFLTAMAQRDIHHVAAWIMLGLAGLIAVGGLIVLLTFPARF